MRAACTSWPDSSTWNDSDIVRMTPTSSWLATTLRVQNDRPSRDRGHVEADRLVGVAAPDEVGVQRVHEEAVVHGRGRGPQALGDDLPAVQAAPRVLGPVAEEHVVALGLELHHRHEVHAGS